MTEICESIVDVRLVVVESQTLGHFPVSIVICFQVIHILMVTLLPVVQQELPHRCRVEHNHHAVWTRLVEIHNRGIIVGTEDSINLHLAFDGVHCLLGVVQELHGHVDVVVDALVTEAVPLDEHQGLIVVLESHLYSRAAEVPQDVMTLLVVRNRPDQKPVPQNLLQVVSGEHLQDLAVIGVRSLLIRVIVIVIVIVMVMVIVMVIVMVVWLRVSNS